MVIRVFEAFAGYGSQSLALERLKENNPFFDYKVVGISEIDEDAVKAYNSLHQNIFNYGDICNIDWLNIPDFDLFTYSFPCQDISTFGKLQGLGEGSGTRSSLLWECRKAIEIKKPKYLLMENVKALTYKKYKDDFSKWKRYLEKLGYTNYCEVLNAAYYGIPQKRERTFMVSILGNHTPFQFPYPVKLNKSFTDYLDIIIDKVEIPNKKDDGTYTTKRLNKILATDKIVPDKIQWIDIYACSSNDKIVPTITTRTLGAGNVYVVRDGFIRKPTPREIFRLMGLREKEIDKLMKLELDSNTYCKLAGNSIVVDVLEQIFYYLF